MKNNLSDVNNYLFEQLERLNDDETLESEDNFKKEIQRKNAIKNNLGKYHILANESTKKKVAKYDKNNNLIEIYESISEASRKNNINITSISYSANGKRKTGGGFIWHFV